MAQSFLCSEEMVKLIGLMSSADSVDMRRFTNDIANFCCSKDFRKVAGSKKVVYRGSLNGNEYVCRYDGSDEELETISLSMFGKEADRTTLKRMSTANILTISDASHNYYKRITFETKNTLFGNTKIVVKKIDFYDEPNF